jgi:hypothetical protein
MFAVVGTWAMDAAMREGRHAALPHLVDGVRQNAGFVKGFWCDDVDDPGVSVTFIVFETLDQARAFREAVVANAPGQASVGAGQQELRIVEVTADA